MTGKELADMIRTEATRRGLSAYQFVKPIARSNSFVEALETVTAPRPITIRRVLALINSDPIPMPDRAIEIKVSSEAYARLTLAARRNRESVPAFCARLITDAQAQRPHSAEERKAA
jgi:hypothetical protein